MIKVWILVIFLGSSQMNPIPPMVDKLSCEKAKAAIDNSYVRERGSCVEVWIPAPSDYAWKFMPGSK